MLKSLFFKLFSVITITVILSGCSFCPCKTDLDRDVLASEDLYRDAMRKYLQRDFLSAAVRFSRLRRKTPGFHLVDLAAFYQGKSLENLGLYEAAYDVYKNAAQLYPESEALPRFTVQMMNIDYLTGNDQGVQAKYDQVRNRYPGTDMMMDADYIMGQVFFKQGNYTAVISLLESIEAGDANYIPAQVSIYKAYLALDLRDKARERLEELVRIIPIDTVEKEEQDEAAILLGEIHREAGDCLSSLTDYIVIGPSSPYQEQALIGVAKCFHRLGKPGEAVKALNELLGKGSNSLSTPEALLLLGHMYRELNRMETGSAQTGMAGKGREQIIQLYKASIRMARRQRLDSSEILERDRLAREALAARDSLGSWIVMYMNLPRPDGKLEARYRTHLAALNRRLDSLEWRKREHGRDRVIIAKNGDIVKQAGEALKAIETGK